MPPRQMLRSGYDLQPYDQYYTPEWVTEALCREEALPSHILEPAQGEGHIVGVLTRYCESVIGEDITNTGVDFLKMPRESFLGGRMYMARAIITNPPYSHGLAEKFVRHALHLMCPVGGKVAMLLPHAWDSAKGRVDLFKDNPAFKAKYTLIRRIRWANLDQKAAGPSKNHAWYVWDWAADTRHGPVCHYL